MIENLDRIWWQDSWILGWRKDADSLTLFVELHVTRDHPAFEPFDRKKFFACYKTARLVVGDLQSVKGLPYDQHDLRWNKTFPGEEFDDVAEFENFDLKAGGTKLSIYAGASRAADDLELEVDGGSIDLVFEDFKLPLPSA